jgi:hypothetical protein
VIADLGGIYATAPTCYLTLLARVEAFRFRQLDRLLYEQRRLIRMRTLRGSSYLVPDEPVSVFFAATREKNEKALHVPPSRVLIPPSCRRRPGCGRVGA